jgi:hypothetical protein
MENLAKIISIDWKWVEAHLSARERLKEISEDSTKEAALSTLKEALDIAKSKAAPKISFAEKKIVEFRPGSFELEEGVTLSSRELSSHIKGANRILAFLVTIGRDVEEAATSYMNSGDHLLGYLLDRAGSFAVESLAKNTEEGLRRNLLLENLSVSMRFSPGYCDWPIEEQFKLALIIDFGNAGVTLTKSCMMIPKKSISAVVGIGPGGLFTKIKSPCILCNMKVCDYRRKD